MEPKRRAAEAAIAHLRSGMRIGLGTGSTAEFFHRALAAAIADGRLTDVVGVPTSVQAETHAGGLGIPLATLIDCPVLDVTVDGADEVAPNLDLIKGLGGALVREKIVAQNSRRFVIIADQSKVVSRLGERVSVPVEVVQFAHESQDRYFRSLGAVPVLRRAGGGGGTGGGVFITDNGNFIYDCKFAEEFDPAELERKLLDHAGVVGTGLFLGMATTAIVADADGVREMSR